MRLRAIFAVLLTVFSCALFLPAQQSQQPVPPAEPPAVQAPPLRQTVTLVNVLFSVFDKRDRLVSDLTRDDFSVLDDNVAQQVRFFSRQTDLPLRVGLLIDTSNSIRQRLQFEKDAAIDFLTSVLRPDKDQAFLMTVDDDPELIQDFTGDIDRLKDVIQKQRAGGGTALYDAVYKGCQQFAQAPDPKPLAAASATPAGPDVRRVLVVISDGDDNLSRHSRGEALEMAERTGVVIYTISTSTNWVITDQETNQFNLANRKYQKDEGDRVLDQFSDESGGRAFFPFRADDLAMSFRDIGEELRSQYSLGYVPAGRLTDGRYHTIKLVIGTKGFRVHARKGYYATAAVSE
jgi:Ca-activated chloride channel homolog